MLRCVSCVTGPVPARGSGGAGAQRGSNLGAEPIGERAFPGAGAHHPARLCARRSALTTLLTIAMPKGARSAPILSDLTRAARLHREPPASEKSKHGAQLAPPLLPRRRRRWAVPPDHGQQEALQEPHSVAVHELLPPAPLVGGSARARRAVGRARAAGRAGAAESAALAPAYVGPAPSARRLPVRPPAPGAHAATECWSCGGA
jgi:hypothetical protein